MDIATLLAAMPGLTSARAKMYLAPMEAAMLEFGISSELRSRMWLAQVGHESGSLVYFEEIASGAAYEGRSDLGNTHQGDGVRFKGRGPIQITGRYNYTEAGLAMKLPLADQPELAADPSIAFKLSAWWWATHGLNQIADTGDVVAATRRINGGTRGLEDRQARYARATALGARVIPGTPATAPALAPSRPGDDIFIRKANGDVLWLIHGPDPYWRPVPKNAADNLKPSQVTDDKDGELLKLYKVGSRA